MIDRYKYQRQREMERHQSELTPRQRVMASLDPLVRLHISTGECIADPTVPEETREKLSDTYLAQSRTIRRFPEMFEDLKRWNDFLREDLEERMKKQ